MLRSALQNDRAIDKKQNGAGINEGGPAYTLDQTGGQAVAFKIRCGKETYIKPDGSKGTAGKGLLMSEDKAFTVASSQDQHLMHDTIVRRLTPRECERLQGFPDDYTLIPWRGKPADQCPDGPRYKALGNSMAVPVLKWIGQRIQMWEGIHQTDK
jgi:DNA (cytosine-5)-methyltransferase 1